MAVTYTIGEQVLAIFIVAAVSAGAGIFVGLFFGFTFPAMSCIGFKGYRLQPLIKIVQIPSLIIMIIIGCIARNLFGHSMNAWPSLWSSYIRSIALCFLLMRGGMQVTFQGKGLQVVMLSFLP